MRLNGLCGSGWGPFRALWPGAPWIIAGVAEPEPELRAYAIDGARIEEVPVGET